MNALAPIGLMLRHEARLNWRAGASYASHTTKIVLLVCIVVFMHLIATIVPFVIQELPAMPRTTVLAAATGSLLIVFGLMISATLVGTVKLIYTRADMDLLLSSPIPPFAIVTVRVLAVVLGVLALAGILLLPFANMMAVFDHPRYLVAYPVLVGTTLAASAIGMLLAQGLFYAFGPRRTRLFAQILAAVLGVAMAFIGNLHVFLPPGVRERFLQWLTAMSDSLPAADSLIWLPARAVLGELLPALLLTFVCAGLFVLVAYALANRLMASAVAANGVAANTVKTRSSRMLKPQRGPIAVARSKEWLLIGRDPWLLTQMVKQMALTLPALYLIWHTTASPYAWLGIVILTGQLAGSLTWLTVSTEDAPDLLMIAPVSRTDMLWAKLQAALIPTALVMALPVAAAFLSGPRIGVTVAICCVATALCTAIYHLRHAAPAKRSQIERRGDDKQMHGVFELAIGLVWSAFGLTVLMAGWWALLAAVLLAPILYRLVR